MVLGTHNRFNSFSHKLMVIATTGSKDECVKHLLRSLFLFIASYMYDVSVFAKRLSGVENKAADVLF